MHIFKAFSGLAILGAVPAIAIAQTERDATSSVASAVAAGDFDKALAFFSLQSNSLRKIPGCGHSKRWLSPARETQKEPSARTTPL
jgi:hypothetical protein